MKLNLVPRAHHQWCALFVGMHDVPRVMLYHPLIEVNEAATSRLSSCHCAALSQRICSVDRRDNGCRLQHRGQVLHGTDDA